MSEQTQWQKETIKNTKNLAIWTLGWVLTMALANFGPHFLWDKSTLISVLAISLNLLAGIGMIWANKVHLLGLDEMQQRVQLNAMAIALGVGLVFGLAYSNLDTAKVIGFDAEISHLVILISLTYAFSTVIGLRKYR